MFKPSNPQETIEIAELQEQQLEVKSKRDNKMMKGWDGGGLHRHNNYPITRAMGTVKNYNSGNQKGLKNEAPITESRKISPQEIQYRRNNHICFRCGESYSPGH